MRYLIFALSMTTMSASASFAQNVDWTGAYGGVTKGAVTGTHDYYPSDLYNYDPRYNLEGHTAGAFGGFLWAKDQLVYGAEVGLSVGDVYETSVDGSVSYRDEYQYEKFLDLKGRLGYTTGNLLVYGTLGMSRTQFKSGIGDLDEVDTTVTGTVVGVGLDYKISNRYFVGAEYLRRNYEFYDSYQDIDIDAKINTVTLRLGMQF